MLAPRASNAFVCIRCELQLARRRLPAYARATSRATFSTSARRQDGADELEALSQPPPSTLRIKREKEPLDRIRRRKGKAIRETSTRLGNLKLLGDDAEILVLREVGDDAPKEPDSAPEPVERLPVPDISAILQEEHEALTPKDIQDRLESLRPKTDVEIEPGEPHYVSQKSFVKLIRDLTQGFTQPQLSQFYSVVKNVQQKELHKEMLASLKEETGTTKRPVVRSNWQPGTTPINRRLPGIDVVTRFKRAPVSKQLLVDRIMRDLWKLVPLEEVEGRGEIELSLKPWQITMLNAGGEETFLSKLSEARKARIEVYQQHSILRITADKTTAEYTAFDVEKALLNIHVKKVQLKLWVPWLEEAKVSEDLKLADLFTQEHLDMVTSLTRVSIQKIDGSNTLAIRGLDKDSVAEAERILIRLLPLKDATLRTIDTHKLDGVDNPSKLYPTSYDEKLLESRYRNAHLGRWSSPVTKYAHAEVANGQEPQEDAVEESSEESVTSEEQVARIIKSLRQAIDQAPSKTTDRTGSEASSWDPEPMYKLSAEFGQALFPLVDMISGSAATSDLSSSRQHLFTPSVPGLTSFLSSAYVQGVQKNSSAPVFRALARTDAPSLLYDFVAAPEQPQVEAGQTIPTLHIQLRTSLTGGEVTLHKLSLGFQEHVHDVLLPESAADIRFVRYGRLRLSKDASDKNVHKWAEAVCANIASGGRLTAPPLTLDIPAWTIAGSPGEATGMRSITYLFSGVQFRQAVSGAFLDTPMSYSTTQAGKTGAQGGALAMYYKGVGPSAEHLLTKEAKLDAFVHTCLNVVEKITAAANQTQPVLKTLRPRSTESGRKQRRAGQQVVAAKTDDDVDELQWSVAPESEAIEDDDDGDILDILDDALLQVEEKSRDDAVLEKAEEVEVEIEEHAPFAFLDGGAEEVVEGMKEQLDSSEKEKEK